MQLTHQRLIPHKIGKGRNYEEKISIFFNYLLPFPFDIPKNDLSDDLFPIHRYRDARAVLERNIALNTKGGVDNEATLYRGQAGYKNFVEKDMAQVGAAKHTGYEKKLISTLSFHSNLLILSDKNFM